MYSGKWYRTGAGSAEAAVPHRANKRVMLIMVGVAMLAAANATLVPTAMEAAVLVGPLPFHCTNRRTDVMLSHLAHLSGGEFCPMAISVLSSLHL